MDRIIINANIYKSSASALAIWQGRIYALGTDDEIRALTRPQTTIDNAEGHFIMPGLVDAHIHWEGTAKARHAVALFEVPTKAEALERVAAKRTSDSEWIYGMGWTQDIWESRAFPTKFDLDSVTGNQPAYLVTKSGHAAWVNSAALRIAGIDANTSDPPGGKIGRDADGNPNGILFEMPAMQLVSQHIPSITPEKLADWMQEAQSEAWQRGLTGIHDFDNPSCMVALQLLRERGDLGLRVLKQINDPWIENAHALGIRAGFGDVWLRIGALKIFADGALGPRTASMIQPYEGEPDNYGVVVTDKETIYKWVSRASRQGLASTVHAIGDKAVHDVLEVFQSVRAEEAQNGIPRAARRHRIEHVQLIHPDDLPRLAELDIIASMQPIHATSDINMADSYWGERAAYSYQWRIQKDAGATLAFGSDSPIDPFDPFLGLYAAVTRRRPNGYPSEAGWYPEAKVSLDEAIEAYTVGAAYAAGTENHMGKLAPGYLADCIMLDRDITAEPPEALLETKVLGTMVGGEWKYRA